MEAFAEFFPGAVAGLPIALAVALVSASVKRGTLKHGAETGWTDAWYRIAPIFRMAAGFAATYLPGVAVDPFVGLLAGGFSAELYNTFKVRAGFKKAE